MSRKTTKHRLLAAALSLCMILSLFNGIPAFAQAANETGFCEHHTEHTAECGYAEPVEGQPCAHIHDETCGYAESSEGAPCAHTHDDTCGYIEGAEEIPCDMDCTDMDDDGVIVHTENCAYTPAIEGTLCAHELGRHDDECGYAAPTEGTPCAHELGVHDDSCDYIEAVEGSPCTFVCEECSGIVTDWSWVDPDEYLSRGTLFGLADVDWMVSLVDMDEEVLREVLPAQINATLKNSEETVLPITWDFSKPQEYQPSFWETLFESNVPHYYIFTAALPEGYALDKGVDALEVLVMAAEIMPLANYSQIIAFRLTLSDGTQRIVACNNSAGNDSTDTITGKYYVEDHDINGVALYWDDVNNGNVFNETEAQEFTSTLQNYKLEVLLPSWTWDPSYGQYGGSHSWWQEINVSGATYNGEKSNLANHYAFYEIQYTEDTITWNWANNQGGDNTVHFYVRIIDAPVPLGPVTEEINNAHIVTDRVVDPPKSTVNFFDYWVTTNQYDNDFQAFTSDATGEQAVINGPINQDHLFIFAGGWTFNGAVSGGTKTTFGEWNIWTGDGINNPHQGQSFNVNTLSGIYKPHRGIVARKLGVDGYPVLALRTDANDSNNYHWYEYTDYENTFPTGGNFSTYFSNTARNKPNESLEYIFAPTTSNGKEAFPNVTGLFQLDDEGYYYYNSRLNFAELNESQDSYDDKDSITGNHITLYDTPWEIYGDNETYRGGQFFPFNNWSNLFASAGTGNQVVQRNDSLEEQVADVPEVGDTSYEAETINHHHGMTMEIEFQQPVNGTINRGTAGSIPMSFTFSGDDDVWIFIDGVLVGDVGGIHDAVGIEIDFSTGEIIYTAIAEGGEPEFNNNGTRDTLRSMYTAANENNNYAWNGNTFASGSIHTLKFFYLERGNDVSNCALRFNLQPVVTDRIRKVDEAGNPLNGVTFNIYQATLKDGVSTGQDWYIADNFNRGELVVSATTLVDGYADLVDANNEAIDWSSKGDFFILEEVNPLNGYRANPDIVLRYYSDDDDFVGEAPNTFTVVNKYETGAYASFIANWQETGTVHKAIYTPSTGTISESDTEVSESDLETGFALVIPVIKKTTGEGSEGVFQRWLPMYGSNTNAWNTITDSYQDNVSGTNTQAQFERDLALAAFLQIADVDERSQDWFLSWDEIQENPTGTSTAKQLEGYLQNLPGDATRYLVNNLDGDLNLVALFLPETVLKTLIGDTEYANCNTDEERLAALKDALQSKIEKAKQGNANATDEEIIKGVLESSFPAVTTSPFSLLYTDTFERTYRTVIFVPNEQRELRIRKLDDSGNYIDGAVFAIFDTAAHADAFTGTTLEDLAAAKADPDTGLLAYGTTVKGEQDGLLIFREDGDDEDPNDGTAQITWPSEYHVGTGISDTDDSIFWLKEIAAPEGYEINEYLVRIEVGNTAIYANATGYEYKDGSAVPLTAGTDDGIRVVASLGKLAQTLTKYAVGNSVDVTLQDITIYKQTQAGTGDVKALDSDGWSAVDTSSTDFFNLHYNMNSEYLSGQYGLHSGDTPTTALYQNLPVFYADDGYIRVMPRQTAKEVVQTYASVPHDLTAKRDSIEGTDLVNLFGLVNVIEVVDPIILEGTGDLVLTKTVTGSGGDKTKEFSFEITLTAPTDGELGGTYAYTLTGPGASTTTGNVTLTETAVDSGVYTVKIDAKDVKLTDGQTITIENLPAGTKYVIKEGDNDGYTVTVTGSVTADGATGTIRPDTTIGATATNIVNYENRLVNPVTVNLQGTKMLTGATLADRQFSFTITPAEDNPNGDPITDEVTVTNSADGTITLFSNVAYYQTGVYTYTVREVVDTDNTQYQYDTTYYEVTVTVTEDTTTDGLSAAVAILKNGGIAVDDDEGVVFENKYTPSVANMTLRGVKTFEGGTLRGNDFTFEITAVTDGAPLPSPTTVQNAADGMFAFGNISYTEAGTYEYQIKEISGSDTSIKYDDTVYVVIITVSDTGGALTASVTYNGNASENGATFTNRHRQLTGNLTVSKTVTGNAGSTTKEFTFTVTLSDRTINGTYGDMSFENGEARFALKHNESKTATGLPAGITYTVTESDNTGYTVSSTGATGTIPENGTATAAFTNNRTTTTTDDDGNLIVTKTVTGSAGDRDKEFTFTVTLSSRITGIYGNMRFVNGVATVKLKHGESVRATGLPSGITYTVTEAEADQDGYTTSSTGSSGRIPANGTATAAFVNAKSDTPPDPGTGDLTVNKTVTGDAGDRNKEFHFTVTLSDRTINGTYGDVTFVNGVASFTLRHGESKTIRNLPEGITYTVAETEANQDGYTTSASGRSGTITDGGHNLASFINDKPDNPPDNPPDKPDNPPDNPPDSPPYNPPDDVPQTGDNSHLELWLALMVLSAIGMLGVGFFSNRKRKLFSAKGRRIRK